MDLLAPAVTWVPLESLYRLTMALAVGLFVGLEREWRGKEAGLRTFGFSALLGGMGGLLGPEFGMLSVALLSIPIIFLNIQSLKADKGTELTTSTALLVTGFTGLLCGQGHKITPAAVAVVTAGLLAWKERLAVFSHKITSEELRSAILLAILTFAILPVLPGSPIDPWGLIAPRAAWLTVILIAAIGFVNYLLWKTFGKKGIELTGFFGGLVNSTVVVTELASRVRAAPKHLQDVAYRGVLLSTAAMALRNAVILGFLAISAFTASVIPLLIILILCGLMIYFNRIRAEKVVADETPSVPLTSPFSIYSALKFGMIFLILHVLGVIAQSLLGHAGFYAVSIAGGIVSSASAVASAASLVAQGKISAQTAGVGAVLASLASAAINVGLVARYSGDRTLTMRLARSMSVILVLTIIGAILQSHLIGVPAWLLDFNFK